VQTITIYTRVIAPEFHADLINMVELLASKNITLLIFKPSEAELLPLIEGKINFEYFEKASDLNGKANFLVSIGGDGTLLDATLLIGNNNIPIVGINAGRLGFLARISIESLQKEIESLLDGAFTIEERAMLKLKSPSNLFAKNNFALNECSIHKLDPSSMVKVHTYINNEFLNTYFSDGLLISTPTGSTAYNLSCGGPIVYPGSNNFVLTAVAPHNLNVRPIVLPDHAEIKMIAECRSGSFLVNLDSRSVEVESGTTIIFTKNDFTIKLLKP